MLTYLRSLQGISLCQRWLSLSTFNAPSPTSNCSAANRARAWSSMETRSQETANYGLAMSCQHGVLVLVLFLANPWHGTKSTGTQNLQRWLMDAPLQAVPPMQCWEQHIHAGAQTNSTNGIVPTAFLRVISIYQHLSPFLYQKEHQNLQVTRICPGGLMAPGDSKDPQLIWTISRALNGQRVQGSLEHLACQGSTAG